MSCEINVEITLTLKISRFFGLLPLSKAKRSFLVCWFTFCSLVIIALSIARFQIYVILDNRRDEKKAVQFWKLHSVLSISVALTVVLVHCSMLLKHRPIMIIRHRYRSYNCQNSVLVICCVVITAYKVVSTYNSYQKATRRQDVFTLILCRHVLEFLLFVIVRQMSEAIDFLCRNVKKALQTIHSRLDDINKFNDSLDHFGSIKALYKYQITLAYVYFVTQAIMTSYFTFSNASKIKYRDMHKACVNFVVSTLLMTVSIITPISSLHRFKMAVRNALLLSANFC